MGEAGGKLRALDNPRQRSFVHIEGDPEGRGPFKVKFQGVSLQLIVVLEQHIAEWKEELYDIVQDDEEEEEGTMEMEVDLGDSEADQNVQGVDQD